MSHPMDDVFKSIDKLLSRNTQNGIKTVALEEIARLATLEKGAKFEREVRDRFNLIKKIASKAAQGKEWWWR